MKATTISGTSMAELSVISRISRSPTVGATASPRRRISHPARIADRPGRHVDRQPQLRVARQRGQAHFQRGTVDFAPHFVAFDRIHEIRAGMTRPVGSSTRISPS